MQKRFFCLCVVISLIIGQALAIDYSVGITPPGFGKAILRAENAQQGKKGKTDLKEDVNLSLFPMVQIDFILEFFPFFALETGIGYGLSTISWSGKDEGVETKWSYKKDGIVIPLMARAQYAFGMFSLYAAIGPKFVIPISNYRTTEIEDKESTSSDISLDKTGFILDIGFAIGGELKIRARYLGMRFGYDLNLTSPIYEENNSAIYKDWYHDNFNISFTFRHML